MISAHLRNHNLSQAEKIVLIEVLYLQAHIYLYHDEHHRLKAP